MKFIIETTCGYRTSTFSNYYDCFKELENRFESSSFKIYSMEIITDIKGDDFTFTNYDSESLQEIYDSQSWA